MNKISGIIITKNEEEMIEDCVKSLSFCDEVIVVDSYSTDNTVSITERLGAKVVQTKFTDFSAVRDFALSLSLGDWILYLDADERATDEFKQELVETIKNYREGSGIGGYFIRRKNFYYGRDWNYIDRVQRLFYRKFFIGWEGKVHETPRIKGKFGKIKSPVLHYTHRDLTKMVEKTNEWSEFEAELRFKAHHPKMNLFRFVRVMLTSFVKSFFFEKGYKNGTAGLVEGIYQAFSMFITYAKLWEKQISNQSKK